MTGFLCILLDSALTQTPLRYVTLRSFLPYNALFTLN